MSGLLRRGLPAMWKVNPLWAFFSVALISLGTLVVACRQVVVGGGGGWKGGGMDGGMNTGPPWPPDWVVQILSNPSLTLKPTPGLRSELCPCPSPPTTSTLHIFPPLISSILPPSSHSVSIPNSKTFWWGSLPDRQTARVETERGFAAWRASRVASEGWQWFTIERVLLLHCAPNLPSTATPTPTNPPATWLQPFLSSCFTVCQSNNPDRLLLGLLPRNEGHDR